MNIDQFLTGFPEFGDTDASLVMSKLEEAALEVNTDPASGFGPFSALGQAMTIADTVHGYLTAHKLALSPFGQNARMIAADGTTTYEKHLNKIVGKTIVGVGVTGEGTTTSSSSDTWAL